jgi:hypothetical protein
MVSTTRTKRYRSEEGITYNQKRKKPSKSVSFNNKIKIRLFEIEEGECTIPPLTLESDYLKKEYESSILHGIDRNICEYLDKVYEYTKTSIRNKYEDFSSRKKELFCVISSMKKKFFDHLCKDEELEGLFLQEIQVFIYKSIHFEDFFSDCLAELGTIKSI